jgi:hypothetical protein
MHRPKRLRQAETASDTYEFETTNHNYKVTFAQAKAGVGGAGCTLFLGRAVSLQGEKETERAVVVKKGAVCDPDLAHELQVLKDCCRDERNPRLPLYIGSRDNPPGAEAGRYVVMSQGPSDLASMVGVGEKERKKAACAPQSLRFALQVVIQLLDALEPLHGQGWVHCDVQPENILVHDAAGQPQVTLIDFGACLKKGSNGRNRCWEYSAPEQWATSPVHEGTDVFGAAAILFYLLFGYAPFPNHAGRFATGLPKDPAGREAYKAQCITDCCKHIAPAFGQFVHENHGDFEPSVGMTHYLWHDSLSVEFQTEHRLILRGTDVAKPHGIRHLLWMTLGQTNKDERLSLHAMRSCLQEILRQI